MGKVGQDMLVVGFQNIPWLLKERWIQESVGRGQVQIATLSCVTSVFFCHPGAAPVLEADAQSSLTLNSPLSHM